MRINQDKLYFILILIEFVIIDNTLSIFWKFYCDFYLNTMFFIFYFFFTILVYSGSDEALDISVEKSSKNIWYDIIFVFLVLMINKHLHNINNKFFIYFWNKQSFLVYFLTLWPFLFHFYNSFFLRFYISVERGFGATFLLLISSVFRQTRQNKQNKNNLLFDKVNICQNLKEGLHRWSFSSLFLLFLDFTDIKKEKRRSKSSGKNPKKNFFQIYSFFIPFQYRIFKNNELIH